MTLQIDASLWSADLTALGAAIRRYEPLVDSFHIDVADAHFVPGLLFFPDLVAALRPLTRVPFHVHLMVADPVAHVAAFLDAGADWISVHLETGAALEPALAAIRVSGRRVGLAVKLETSLDRLQPYLDHVDLLLLMGTQLGVKGQSLAPDACARITATRDLLRAAGHDLPIVADGGIRAQTVPLLRAAGASAIVPGSLLFASDDPAAAVAAIREHP